MWCQVFELRKNLHTTTTTSTMTTTMMTMMMTTTMLLVWRLFRRSGSFVVTRTYLGSNVCSYFKFNRSSLLNSYLCSGNSLIVRSTFLYLKIKWNHFEYVNRSRGTIRCPSILSVWPDLAKFRHFGKILTVLGKIFLWFGFVIWPNSVPVLAILCLWAIFQWYKRPKIEK